MAHLYPEDAAALPESLVSLMDGHYAVLDANLRRTLFQSLVLLRNRGRMAPQRLIGLAFRLFRCQDKVLRAMLYSHIVTDVRNINKAGGLTPLPQFRPRGASDDGIADAAPFLFPAGEQQPAP